MRGPGDRMLTADELRVPAVFSLATSRIPGYKPEYNFEHIRYVRLARMPFVGPGLGSVLDRLVQGWQGSPEVSLVLERESLAAAILSIFLLVVVGALHLGLRWHARMGL
jgi:hypothetical protein